MSTNQKAVQGSGNLTGLLVLGRMGSFFVGGRMVEQTPIECGLSDLGITSSDLVPVEQMYVSYLEPVDAIEHPVVLVHGLTVSGKCYETQPDGRMGWNEYFVRNGYPVYMPDQVTRGRSGFNQAEFNNARAGVIDAATQAPLVRVGVNFARVEWRYGTKDGSTFEDTQFPVDHIDEFLKQTAPSPFDYATPNETPQRLAELAEQLEGAVLVGHSESAMYPVEAALANPSRVKGLVIIEAENPDPDQFTDEDIAKLAEIPITFLYGDHLDAEMMIPDTTWLNGFGMAKVLIERINAAGGNASLIHPPELGIHGNSHMPMIDKNSDQIADLIMFWIQKHVGKR
ncbi:hypothetical protein ACQPZ2_29805 [Nocardia pseudovaccinii]|uniref:hypothetical protein n=1 Tax=Nocardia pseudovaccinii TaxID=189540 RepID=UPI003D8ACECE